MLANEQVVAEEPQSSSPHGQVAQKGRHLNKGPETYQKALESEKWGNIYDLPFRLFNFTFDAVC